MGLFSRKKKINVSSVVYNIAGDADERGSFLKENMTYLTAANHDIAPGLSSAYRQSTGVGFKAAYKYAASLPQGLPKASVQLYENRQLEQAVQALLDAEYGPGKFFVEDSYFSKGNSSASVEKYLSDTYGWDAVTGEMSCPRVGFTSVSDVQWAEYTPQMRGDTSPDLFNYITIEFRNGPDSALPDYSTTVALPVTVQSESDTLITQALEYLKALRSEQTVTRAFQPGDVTGTVVTNTSTGAGHSRVDTTTTVATTTDGTNTTITTKIEDESFSGSKTFSHVVGLGLWPTLDTLYANRAMLDAGFFPTIPLRVDNQDLMRDSVKKTAAYRQKLRLGKLLGVDVKGLVDQINSNQSVKDIDHAFLVAGANMNTESQTEMDYLFRFWDMCRAQHQQHDVIEYATWMGLSLPVRVKPNMNVLEITDPESTEKAYKITIEWNYIEKFTVTGSITPGAKAGRFRMVRGTPSAEEYRTKNNSFNVDSTIVTIMKQVTETTYEEIRISGAIHKNYVYNGKIVETTAANARTKPDDETGFLVPLFMPIFTSMPMVKRTQLSRECMSIVFNCYVVTKQKWYQTSIFKIVLAIVLIIISVISFGKLAPLAVKVWGAVAVATALNVSVAVVAAILSAIYGYVASYVIGKLQGSLTKVFGEKLGRVIAAVATIIVSFYAGGGSLASLMTNTLQSAVQILGAVSQVFSAYAQGTMTQAAKRQTAYMEGIKEQQKALEEQSKNFFGEGMDGLSVESLLQIQQILREETPDVYLTRTLIIGSEIVDMTLGMVSDMVSIDVHTRLPGIA